MTWQPHISPFVCPSCGGGFEEPSRIDTGDRGVRHGCPWCGEISRYALKPDDELGFQDGESE